MREVTVGGMARERDALNKVSQKISLGLVRYLHVLKWRCDLVTFDGQIFIKMQLTILELYGWGSGEMEGMYCC